MQRSTEKSPVPRGPVTPKTNRRQYGRAFAPRTASALSAAAAEALHAITAFEPLEGRLLFAAGSFSFSAPTYSVGESGPVATITVNRVGGSDGSVTVDVATSNGTAAAPADYADSDQT